MLPQMASTLVDVRVNVTSNGLNFEDVRVNVLPQMASTLESVRVNVTSNSLNFEDVRVDVTSNSLNLGGCEGYCFLKWPQL